MKKLSTGEDSTLSNWRKIAAALTGEGSDAVKYFDDKIAKQGADEEVIADETQVLAIIGSMMPKPPAPEFLSEKIKRVHIRHLHLRAGWVAEVLRRAATEKLQHAKVGKHLGWNSADYNTQRFGIETPDGIRYIVDVKAVANILDDDHDPETIRDFDDPLVIEYETPRICTCAKSNIDSLSCPVHGLDAGQKGDGNG